MFLGLNRKNGEKNTADSDFWKWVFTYLVFTTVQSAFLFWVLSLQSFLSRKSLESILRCIPESIKSEQFDSPLMHFRPKGFLDNGLQIYDFLSLLSNISTFNTLQSYKISEFIVPTLNFEHRPSIFFIWSEKNEFNRSGFIACKSTHSLFSNIH